MDSYDIRKKISGHYVFLAETHKGNMKFKIWTESGQYVDMGTRDNKAQAIKAAKTLIENLKDHFNNRINNNEIHVGRRE